MAKKIVQMKEYNGSSNDDLIPQNAQTADYPTGFSSMTNVDWGATAGSGEVVSGWVTSNGGIITFKNNYPSSDELSIILDGTVFVNEGNDKVCVEHLIYSSTEDNATVDVNESISIGDTIVIEYGFTLGSGKFRQQLTFKVMQLGVFPAGNVTISQISNHTVNIYSINFFILLSTKIQALGQSFALDIPYTAGGNVTSPSTGSSVSVYIYKVYKKISN